MSIRSFITYPCRRCVHSTGLVFFLFTLTACARTSPKIDRGAVLLPVQSYMAPLFDSELSAIQAAAHTFLQQQGVEVVSQEALDDVRHMRALEQCGTKDFSKLLGRKYEALAQATVTTSCLEFPCTLEVSLQEPGLESGVPQRTRHWSAEVDAPESIASWLGAFEHLAPPRPRLPDFGPGPTGRRMADSAHRFPNENLGGGLSGVLWGFHPNSSSVSVAAKAIAARRLESDLCKKARKGEGPSIVIDVASAGVQSRCGAGDAFESQAEADCICRALQQVTWADSPESYRLYIKPIRPSEQTFSTGQYLVFRHTASVKVKRKTLLPGQYSTRISEPHSRGDLTNCVESGESLSAEIVLYLDAAGKVSSAVATSDNPKSLTPSQAKCVEKDFREHPPCPLSLPDVSTYLVSIESRD